MNRVSSSSLFRWGLIESRMERRANLSRDCAKRYVRRGGEERVSPKAKIVFGSNNRDAQATMCASGAGYAVLPCPLGDADARLKRFDVGVAPAGRDVWLVITAISGESRACELY
ncbi:hypothetical protein [Caballeronia zhejiangensis]|uniref:hypothetical protein n=1 Tax=Caballeronia zhejiangensis TaxID=871203 RepID=UPI001EF6F32E|nr:hypothetical protein [Caballeronia zhejiangensis]MCG7401152.1 hypothetical protein [Caballeronia zhejiangensis]